MRCEKTHLLEEFLHNLFPCFDVTFGQLSIITKISYNFVKIVLVAQCYLIITYAQYQESKKQMFRIYLLLKLIDRGM